MFIIAFAMAVVGFILCKDDVPNWQIGDRSGWGVALLMLSMYCMGRVRERSRNGRS